MMETKLTIHNQEAEEGIIRAVIADPGNLPTVKSILKPDCFYLQQPREIYKAILSLDVKKMGFDIVNITTELKRTGKLEAAGGIANVSAFLDSWYRFGSVEEHAMHVYEKYALREMAAVSMKIYNLVHEPNADALNIMDVITRDISNINFISKVDFQTIGQLVQEVIAKNKKVLTEGVRPGISTGFTNVDRFMRKQKQELGVIAARPGMGKTAYMLANAKHTAVVLKKPVLIFSLEMSAMKLAGRIMASEAEMASQKINDASLNEHELMAVGASMNRLHDAPMYFDDIAGLDLPQLRSKIRRAIREYGIEEVYLDYLQLMLPEKKGNREQEISHISRNLKMIAKEENIVITALSQLSREVERRTDKRPMLADLRESGAIEQDADWVLFLFRPEYYGIRNEQTGAYEEQTFNGRHLRADNLLVVDCAKYREGAQFKAALRFYGEFMKIENYDVGFESLQPTTTSNQFPAPAPPPQQPNTDFLEQKEKPKDDLPF